MNETCKDTVVKAGKSRPPRTRRSRWTVRRVLFGVILLALSIPAAGMLIPVTRWVRAEGYVTTEEEVEIRPSVEGAIESWAVENGQTVRKGDVLVRLKSDVHRAALAQAISERKVAEARLADLKKNQELAEARRKEQIYRAERELERLREELQRMEESKTGAVSQREIADARLRVEVAKSNLAELRLDRSEAMAREVKVLEEQIEAARKAEARQAAEVELRTLRAAIGGVVQLHRFEPGEVVKPEHVLGQIFDTSRWIVKLTLPEHASRYVQTGQIVRVELSAWPAWRYGYCTARITEIQNVVTPRPTGEGVFYAEAALEAPGEKALAPGMRVSAEVHTGRTNLLSRLILGE